MNQTLLVRPLIPQIPLSLYFKVSPSDFEFPREEREWKVKLVSKLPDTPITYFVCEKQKYRPEDDKLEAIPWKCLARWKDGKETFPYCEGLFEKWGEDLNLLLQSHPHNVTCENGTCIANQLW